MSLADYLAKNYLRDDSKSKKKSKRKRTDEDADRVVLKSDDVLGWENTTTQGEDGDEVEESIEETAARARKPVRWRRLGEEESIEYKRNVLETNSPREDISRMSSGARAGLQTAEEVQKDIEAKQKAEIERLMQNQHDIARQDAETIYRDASGRRIDLKAQMKEEQIRKEKEQLDKKRLQEERRQGLVQRVESEKRKQQLKDIKSMPISRYADDRKMNEEMKDRERFNDPAARFVTRKEPKGHGKTSVTGLPVYSGAYAPNRFNIPPGVKWDGVDRSNGFEARRFRKQNERKEKEILNYTMAVDE
jgi:pre-mRNA-splicing factor CWC26